MKLQIILGSTRPERQSHKLAKWVENHAKEQSGWEVETVDLRDYEMPLFNEPGSPQYTPDRKPSPVVKKWLDKLDEADAYILVTPEYNRSTSGVLKNALDYVDFQLEKKPVAIVAHGSTGGAQAVSHLRGIIPGLQTFTVPKVVFFTDRVAQGISEDGELAEDLANKPYGHLASLTAMLEDLTWYTQKLRA